MTLAGVQRVSEKKGEMRLSHAKMQELPFSGDRMRND